MNEKCGGWPFCLLRRRDTRARCGQPRPNSVLATSAETAPSGTLRPQVNSTTCSSCSAWVATAPARTTSSWSVFTPSAPPLSRRALLHACDSLTHLLHAGGLRGSWFLQLGDIPAAHRAEGQVPEPHLHDPRQPREPADHAGVRLLRRVPAELWHGGGVEVLHAGALPHALRLVPGPEPTCT